MSLHFCRPCAEHETDPHPCEGTCKNETCDSDCECGAEHAV